MARELFLMQSSDWQFLITTKTAEDYGRSRFSEHHAAFERLRLIMTNYQKDGFLDDRDRLFLRGRVRDEINKGGTKVYPADVEAVAERFPGLNDLCCFAVEDPAYGQNVGMALVLDDSSPARLREIHDLLRRHLADYQMPARLYLVDLLPRTSRGKINRDHIAEICAGLKPVDLRGILSGS